MRTHTFITAIAVLPILCAQHARALQVVPLTVPPNMLVAARPAATDPSPGAAAKGAPKEFLSLKLQPVTTSVLEALALSEPTDTTPPHPDSAAAFARHVMRKDWAETGALLSRLPAEQAGPVYDHLLAQLQKPPPAPKQSGNSSRGQPQSTALFPHDLLQLADIAPGDLTEQRLQALGQILKLTLTGGNADDALLRQLEQGTKRLGGADRTKRLLAAELLFAAGRSVEAGTFLPHFNDALARKQFRELELHARYLLAAAQKSDREEARKHRQRAWQTVTRIMTTKGVDDKARRKALETALNLLPQLDSTQGDGWLHAAFASDPELGLMIVASVAKRLAAAYKSKSTHQRVSAVKLLSRTVEQLLRTQPFDAASWRGPLDLLTLSWLREAEHTARNRRQQQPQAQPYYPGHPYYSSRPPSRSSSQFPVVSAELLLETRPAAAWLALLNESLQPRARQAICQLHLQAGNENAAAALIDQFLATRPDTARSLIHQFLHAWSTSHNPNAQSRQSRYYNPYYRQRYQPGIPLARSRQVQNVEQLAGWIKRWERLGFEEDDWERVNSAFAAAHSTAEVYREEDICRVFGPIERIQPETLATLVYRMRDRLTRVWPSPDVQQKSKTKRKDKDILAEINRGYELALSLLERGLEREPDHTGMLTARGSLLFNWAEFLYGKHEDLTDYTAKREQAFAAYEAAAAAYAAQLPEKEESDYSTAVYDEWFNCVIGASQLADVARQQEPEPERIEAIRQALLAMPPQASDRHLKLFGEGLVSRAQRVPEHMKVGFLRWALRVVGDHEGADDARKLVANYDALVNEILLDVHLDGAPQVGNGQPFGVFVAIHHTTAVDRESGGFRKYLRNLKQQSSYYSGGGKPIDHRDKLEKNIRAAFADGFQIKSITFHKDSVEPRGIGRPGWRELPLAYVVLEAEDASRDRLPPVKMDLVFADKTGTVVLPIASTVQLIDAHDANAVPRATRDVTVTQILDDRDQAEGTLALEIKAAGKGLMPPLTDVLDTHLPPFTVKQTTDHGLVVSGFDLEGEQLAPLTERNWVVELEAAPAADAPRSFRFPRVKLLGLTQALYQRYADADIEDVPEEVALAGLALQPTRWGWWSAGIVALTLCAALAWALLRGRQTETGAETVELALPEHIDAFNALVLLRNLLKTGEDRLTATTRDALQADIRLIEAAGFGPGNSPEQLNEEQLRKTMTKWLESVPSH